jgi:hypothetical protein
MKYLFLFLIVSTAEAATFNRLWIGTKKKNVVMTKFMNDLNQIFFSKTIDVGVRKGLLAYQPYVTKMTNHLPDEVALVTYESEEKYKTIRSTPDGEAYSALHWEYFDKDISKSTVAIAFSNTVATDIAYEIWPDFKDWQQGDTYLAFYQKPEQTATLTSLIQNLMKDRKINDSVIMIKDQFVIEYRSMKNSMTFHPLNLKILEQAKLIPAAVNKASVSFGEGLNVQF